MSREGIIELRNYLGANDSSVFEPLFIAQYLLCPVNTIVYDGFVNWMMKRYMPSAKPGSKVQLNDKIKSKMLKSELYLKYSLLVDLMKIVKKHGRKPLYDWDKNTDLSLIKNGKWGEDEAENDRKKQILAFDGFTTIWLLTLPEKFKEWYDYHLNKKRNIPGVATEVMKKMTNQHFHYLNQQKCTLNFSQILTETTHFFLKAGTCWSHLSII